MSAAEADWLGALRTACTERSQRRVAAALGYSASVVSQVLSGTYRGDLGAVEQAVRGVLLAQTLRCPILGMIRAHVCLESQRRTREQAGTHEAVLALWRACRSGCVHSRIPDTERLAEVGWADSLEVSDAE